MRRLKIYLDTSVISYLDQQDSSEKANDTFLLWKDIKNSRYELYLSDITMEEISHCIDEKRIILAKYLADVDFSVVSISDEMEILAKQIIGQEILLQKSYDDCMHIAAAVISKCDIIVSWNFQNIVNINTINGIREINRFNGHKIIDIYSPTILVEMMNNVSISPDFTIDDIYKIREYNHEVTKNLSFEDRKKYYAQSAKEVLSEIERLRKDKLSKKSVM